METIKKTLEAFRSRLDMVEKGRINYMMRLNEIERQLKDHFAKCPYMKGAPHGGRRKKRRKSRKKKRRSRRRSKRKSHFTTRKVRRRVFTPYSGWSPPRAISRRIQAFTKYFSRSKFKK